MVKFARDIKVRKYYSVSIEYSHCGSSSDGPIKKIFEQRGARTARNVDDV